jgi:hypothetical protein
MAANIGRSTVWSRAERLLLLNIWCDEDIEGQLQGIHRNLPVYARIGELLAEQIPQASNRCYSERFHCFDLHSWAHPSWNEMTLTTARSYSVDNRWRVA